MNQSRSAVMLLAALMITSQILARTPDSQLVHFEKDGLTFDYPRDWVLTDRSNAEAQHLILGRKDSSVLIMIIAYRDFISTNDEFSAARDNITMPFIEDTSLKLGGKERPLWQDARCISVGQTTGMGFELHGRIQNEPSTGEVYALVLGARFTNIVYVRMNKDETNGETSWTTIRNTLRIVSNRANQTNSLEVRNSPENLVNTGVFNGKPMEMPVPKMPFSVERTGTRGKVMVQITIDESGKVIDAQPIKGPNELFPVSVDAARRARFRPAVVCGRPIKARGVIVYDFFRM